MPVKILSIDEAVAEIPSDASVALCGFDIVRAPMALVFALARRSNLEIDLISTPNPLAADLLIGTGSVRAATLAFSGFQFARGFAVGPMWKKAVENETRLDVWFLEPLTDHTDHDVVGNELSAIHDRLRLLPQRGAPLHGFSQHVASGDVGRAEVL